MARQGFLPTRLLKDVVFAEQGLVGENRRPSQGAGAGAQGMGAMALAAVAGGGLVAGPTRTWATWPRCRPAAVAAVPPANGASFKAPNALDKLAALPAPDACADRRRCCTRWG
jgi:type VI secretion system protein ImpL